ncbi:hypothetical protein EDB83DRAFT_2560178 [Lactarius deliciosus]|nr:hypothetical protein EDB83DRAFT_2560178 [Lactarius deliciosus]
MDEKLGLVCFWEAIETYFRSYLKLSSTFYLSKHNLSCSARASVDSGGVACQAVGLGNGRYRTISEMSDWIFDRRVRHHYYDMGVLVLLGDGQVGTLETGLARYKVYRKRRRWRVGVVQHYHPSTQETEGQGRNRNFLLPALLEVLQVLKHVYKQGRLNFMVVSIDMDEPDGSAVPRLQHNTGRKGVGTFTIEGFPLVPNCT